MTLIVMAICCAVGAWADFDRHGIAGDKTIMYLALSVICVSLCDLKKGGL
ncbi:MAG: hypothetical protein BWZ03_00067 [bacterium ADurb.BinA186]|nr:MAG: hypothetical protein BWZ03_00067 [bacterium ADurb.BinA186]